MCPDQNWNHRHPHVLQILESNLTSIQKVVFLLVLFSSFCCCSVGSPAANSVTDCRNWTFFTVFRILPEFFFMHLCNPQWWRFLYFLLFHHTYSLFMSSMEWHRQTAWCIIINFLVLCSICLRSSLVHFNSSWSWVCYKANYQDIHTFDEISAVEVSFEKSSSSSAVLFFLFSFFPFICGSLMLSVSNTPKYYYPFFFFTTFLMSVSNIPKY